MRNAGAADRRGVVRRIAQANRGRAAALLERKFAAMAANPFAFYRGTAHLFYEDLRCEALPESPVTWCAADLHLENFGTFKGDNSLTYFDLNDFDEACLLPVVWDVARFACSVWVAGGPQQLSAPERRQAITVFLDRYRHELLAGRALWIERATAEGAVRKLLKQLRSRTPATLLKSRVQIKDAQVSLIAKGKRALPLSAAERGKALQILRSCREGMHESRDFEWLDAAWRIAGLSSLGLERYVVLGRRKAVRGGRRPDLEAYELIDIKEASPSVAASRSPVAQPRWDSEAARVITIQRRCQAASPAWLSAATAHGKSFVVRQLQPAEDRLDLAEIAGQPATLRGVLETMGRIVAWNHLRSAGRQGAALPDELIAFAGRKAWVAPITRYAEQYGRQVKEDHGTFRQAWEAGAVSA